MQNAEALSPEQISQFLKGSEGVDFAGVGRAEIYGWTEQMLVAQEYAHQGKRQRGAIRAGLAKMTGRSLPRITRLIRQYVRSGKVELKRCCQRRRFPRKYDERDVALLADVDRAHERLSGPATRLILKREYQEYASRSSNGWPGSRFRTCTICATAQATADRLPCSNQRGRVRSRLPIGGNRTRGAGPDSYEWTRCIKATGMEPKACITSMPSITVTQWQVIGCASKISEQFLMPVLEAMLHQFPFRIRGFHAGNGSEFINHTVAKLLGKPLIEFTKSRANRSRDNALVEGKNGAVIRKLIGYGHIAGEHAESLQREIVEVKEVDGQYIEYSVNLENEQRRRRYWTAIGGYWFSVAVFLMVRRRIKRRRKVEPIATD